MPSGRIAKAKTEKTPTAKKPVPPPFLDDVAKAAYAALADVLSESGNLAKTDPKLIEAYAINYGLLIAAYKELHATPLMYPREGIAPAPNPCLAIVNNATAKVVQVIGQLGLSPASAKKIADGLPSGDAAGWSEFEED